MKVRKIFLETVVKAILLCSDGMFSNTISYINEESRKVSSELDGVTNEISSQSFREPIYFLSYCL